MLGLTVVLQIDANYFIDDGTKQYIDYMMIVVIIFQWVRFYQFFLMISELSKMLLTFFAMVYDTIAFMFLVISYLIIVAAIFTTIFQDMKPGDYESFDITIRKMFDNLMASYGYSGFPTQEKEYMHMLMLWVHVFMSHILLLNYLIAILSESYNVMQESGTFLYKVYLYQYCERYMVGLHNEKFGQLVIHPAPICFLNLPILLLSIIPGIVNTTILDNVNHSFAIFMFWLENIVWLTLFLAYEIALSPFVYFKNLFIVAWATQGLFLTLWNTVAWFFAGPFYIVFFIVRDWCYMFRILTWTQGCRQAASLSDELPSKDIDENDEVRCYNEARAIAIAKYFEEKNKAEGGMEGDDGGEE